MREIIPKIFLLRLEQMPPNDQIPPTDFKFLEDPEDDETEDPEEDEEEEEDEETDEENDLTFPQFQRLALEHDVRRSILHLWPRAIGVVTEEQFIALIRDVIHDYATQH